MDWKTQLVICEDIAREAHAGQTRSDGSPYIEHPRRVAEAGLRLPEYASPELLGCVGWLHDVLEDTELAWGDLAARGVHLPVINLVMVLTHKKGESNSDYWKSIAAAGEIAKTAKILDIVDNLTDTPTPRQVGKYCEALITLARY